MKSYQIMKNNELLDELKTNKDGLSEAEANKRKTIYGSNELPKNKKNGIIKLFFLQFNNSITIIMVIAAFLSFIIKEYTDAITIIFIILVDVILGMIQEYRANKSAEILSNMIRVKSHVIRDGKEKEIDATEITVGDIIVLKTGVKISADARILECNNLTVDESILTGESNASEKNSIIPSKEKNISDSKNMVYAGTSVITGRALVVVTNIGEKTEIGKIATEVINSKEELSPLTIRMNKFTKQISVIILFLSLIVMAVLMSVGTPLDELFLTVVGLSVSAMPEGLPLALTLALTIGSKRMSKRNVIVKKLTAVESLGSCTVIASDKTGTLTVNEQTAKKIVLPNGKEYDVEGTGYNYNGKVTGDSNYMDEVKRIGLLGLLNNEAGLTIEDNIVSSYGDSIDLAFLALGKKLDVSSEYEKLDSIPYESENKYSAVFFKDNNKVICSIKGSLETVFEYCTKMKDGNKIVKLNTEKIYDQNVELASKGFRVIAVAEGNIDDFKKKDKYDKKDMSDLVFLGLVGFIDPIREEAKESIKQCKEAGIKVIMITGDHPLTAFSIAKELGLSDSEKEVTYGDIIDEELKKGHESFDEFVKKNKVFTRVTPIQKLEIVESLKRTGEFVAVTGDGVNDAPAIKSANIGVAMGDGSDVAKEASNMIIVDDNFKSILSGIEEGRNAYANIRKVVYMLISCGFSEVLFFLLSIIVGLPIPLLAIQLLWLNLVTDGLQDLALSFEKGEKGVMKQKPRNPKEPLLDKLLIQEILISGLSIGLIVFGVWTFLIKVTGMDTAIARGYVMALMVFIQNIHVFNCRSEKQSAFKIKIFSNWFVPFAVFFSIFLQILIMEIPFLSKIMKIQSIPWTDLLILLLLAVPIIIIMEIFKFIKRKKSA